MTPWLSEEEAAAALSRALPIPSGHDASRRPRRTLRGIDQRGADVEVHLDGPTVVLFVSTTCHGCRGLARLVREGIAGFAVVGALRIPSGGLPSEETARFIGDMGTWVLGDDAFDAFLVRSAPFFCILDASGSIEVEGVAFGASHVTEHCARVLAGESRPDSVRLNPEGN